LEVYLDVLFIENFIVNYLILFMCDIIIKKRTPHLRLMAGAFVGALYVIVMVLCPDFKVIFTVISKLLLSMFIVAVTFYPYKIAAFAKTLIVFYGVTFLYAGACYAIINISSSGGIVKNGIFYVLADTRLELIFICSGIVLVIVRTIAVIVQTTISRKRLVVPLRIVFSDKTRDISALIDTGNSLYEPITRKPVVVVEYKILKDILPLTFQKLFMCTPGHEIDNFISLTECGCDESSLNDSVEAYKRICMIPFSSIGKENGMLIGIKPDFIEVGGDDNKKAYQNVVLGIYNNQLSPENSYQAILNPELAG